MTTRTPHPRAVAYLVTNRSWIYPGFEFLSFVFVLGEPQRVLAASLSTAQREWLLNNPDLEVVEVLLDVEIAPPPVPEPPAPEPDAGGRRQRARRR